MLHISPTDRVDRVAVRLVADAEDAIDRDPSRARDCLRQLAVLFAAGHEAPDAVRGGLAPWQMRRVVAHIDANLSEPVSVADLAAVARLSAGHFCRAFKATSGQTPHAFIVTCRIERSKMLMLMTPDPLSQIASTVGLTDQAHLSRLFRRHLGTTPLAWRRTFRVAA